LLFDIERELSKRVDSGTLNYCIPRFLGFEGLKRREIADGKRIFVNPFEFYAGSIRRIFEYQLKQEDQTTGTRWIKKAIVCKLNIKGDLHYNHKGFWVSDNRSTFDFPEKGSFLKALSLLPMVKDLGYDTLYLSDQLDNLFELSDELIRGFTPNDQFESFIEGTRLLKIKVLTHLDITGMKGRNVWDFLEKKLLFLSEIYGLDGVVLELDSDIELTPLSRIIGRIKKFNPLFTFVFSAQGSACFRSIKKLGFQSVYMDVQEITAHQMRKGQNNKKEDVCALLNRSQHSTHLPVLYAFEETLFRFQSGIGTIGQTENSLKLSVFNTFFRADCIPCIRSVFNPGGEWDQADLDFYYFMQRMCSLKKRYSAFLSEERELKGVLTDSEKVHGRVFRNPVEDAALIVLINTDTIRDHWISVDIDSIELQKYHRVKRKLESFNEKVSYLDVENGYVHIPLRPCEGTLLTVR